MREITNTIWADFFTAVQTGNMPAVSFLKPPAFQNGHAGNSDPLDEQAFMVQIINFLQTRPEWATTAVVIAYDDSDGWYDHVASPTVNRSATVQDALNGTGICGNSTTALRGVNPATLHAQGRCGYGPRLPLVVISPYAKVNFVDHTQTDQSSVLRFIEDNWLRAENPDRRRIFSTPIAGPINNMFDFSAPHASKLFLDTATGVVLPQ